MRKAPNVRIEKYRDNSNEKFKSPKGVNYGLFIIPKIGDALKVISSGNSEDNPYAKGWEHVSVSLKKRCPTWDEMSFIKKLFWRDDETVIQFHPKNEKYVNEMRYCLHLWKKVNHDYELPPQELI